MKINWISWQFFRDVPVVDANGVITNFTDGNATTNSFSLLVKLTGQTGNNGTKTVEIVVPLKYLGNFCKILEVPLINCEVTLDLNWSENCVIVATNVAVQATAFSITDTNFMFQL